MKKIIFITLAFLSAWLIRGQSLERSVLGAAGRAESGANIQLEWTLGELAVSRFAHPNGSINEGFHQVYLTIETEKPLMASDPRFQIYPNPVGAELWVKAILQTNEKVRLRFIDPTGRQLLADRMGIGLVQEQLNLQDFPAGHYYLLVVNDKNEVLHTAKILKQ